MKVDEVLSVKQVDARHGHIDFEGGLIVSGDVNPGMKIRVSGDIVIGGFIEGGWIEAGGSITVRHGIIGRRNEQGEYLCQLNAQGEIHASYAQYAQLEAGGISRSRASSATATPAADKISRWVIATCVKALCWGAPALPIA